MRVNKHSLRKVEDPGGVNPDPDPNLEKKKPDTDPTEPLDRGWL